MEQVLLKEITVPKLAKKFPFIAVCHLALI
jgi:hypothetical protein